MSTTYRIETDKGSYDVEVDDSPQQADQSPQQGPGLIDQAKLAARMVPEAWQMTPMGKVDTAIKDNPTDLLPMAGATLGTAVAPGAGTAAGAGLGQIAKRMIDIKTGRQTPTPMNDPNATLFPSSLSDAASEAVGPAAQTLVNGLPEVGGVKNAIQSGANSLARRGLGIKGALLKRVGLDRANEVGKTMLDNGVIKPFSGTPATLQRAEDLSAKAGQGIGEGLSSLDEAGVPSFEPRKLALKVYEDIRPDYVGGAYNAQHDAAREIANTILAHSNGGEPITFDSAQTLKETLQDMGKFDSNTPSWKSQMYRKASSAVRQAIENSVDKAAGSQVVTEGGPSTVGTDILPKGDKVVGEVHNISPDILQRYNDLKRIYGNAEIAKEGLGNRVVSEASSSPISLRGTVIAAGALSQGHATPALEALGAYEAVSHYGARAGASALNFLNNDVLAENVRRAIASEFISRVNMKEDQ